MFLYVLHEGLTEIHTRPEQLQKSVAHLKDVKQSADKYEPDVYQCDVRE